MFEHLIARRFLSKDKNNFSRPLVRIATITVALGVLVMIMSVSILRGFQKEITDKVVGFGAHITIRSYGWVNDFDEIPVRLSPEQVDLVATLPGVRNVQAVASKGGMLKTDNQILGIIFKGVDASFDSAFFARSIVKGRMPAFSDSTASNEVLVSQRIASRMHIDTGGKARTYFWVGNNYRARAFSVVGIYNTDLSEFDDHYIVGDLRQVQRLNQWDSGQVAAYEVTIDNFDNLDKALYDIKQATPPDLAVFSIREEQPAMFAWLDLLNSNILLIIIVMTIVCTASVVSAFLIMIFEKTSMIGILKTLGATGRSIRRIFMLKAAGIVAKGILIGNAVALLVSLLQAHFHIISLDSESYSVSFVPVDINLWYYLAISAGALVASIAALLIPSTYIAHIEPAKTVRVE